MSWKVVRMIGKTYALLLMVATGGIVFANVAGLAGMFFADEWKSEQVQPWMHGGWIFGALFGLVGGLTGRLRFGGGDRPAATGPVKTMPDATQQETESTEDGQAGHEPESDPKKSGLIGAIAFFGFAGALIGILLGGTLLIFVFSIAYSPLSPAALASSVTVEQDPTSTSLPRPVMTSRHPIVVSVALVPVALGAMIGAIAGGLGAMTGKVVDG